MITKEQKEKMDEWAKERAIPKLKQWGYLKDKEPKIPRGLWLPIALICLSIIIAGSLSKIEQEISYNTTSICPEVSIPDCPSCPAVSCPSISCEFPDKIDCSDIYIYSNGSWSE